MKKINTYILEKLRISKNDGPQFTFGVYAEEYSAYLFAKLIDNIFGKRNHSVNIIEDNDKDDIFTIGCETEDDILKVATLIKLWFDPKYWNPEESSLNRNYASFYIKDKAILQIIKNNDIDFKILVGDVADIWPDIYHNEIVAKSIT